MNRRTLFEHTAERNHQAAVENLAKSLNRSVEGVNSLYAVVLSRFAKTARIKFFLSALVTKRVKELLKDTTPPLDLEGRRVHRSEL